MWCGFVELSGVRALLTPSASKAVQVWRLPDALADPTRDRAAAPHALEEVGYFPSSGDFGSPDGIGGECAVQGARLAIGDTGGQVYSLVLEVA